MRPGQAMKFEFLDNLSTILDRYAYKRNGSPLIRSPIHSPHPEWYSANALGCEIIKTSTSQQKSYGNYLPYEESFVLNIPGGKFVDSSRVVITPDNLILKHPAIDIIYNSDEWRFNELPINKELELKGKVLLLNCSWAGEYYHFMASLIGRYLKYLSFSLYLDDIDYIVVPEQRSFISEWYELLNLPKSKLVEMPGQHVYGGNLVHADQLIIPSTMTFHTLETVAYMRNILLADKKPTPAFRKIYTSRIGSANDRGRHIINEEEIYNKILKPMGFEYVIPENLTMKEKAVIFNEAKYVISPGGSGQANRTYASRTQLAPSSDFCG